MHNSDFFEAPLDGISVSEHHIVHECSDCGLLSRLADPIAGTDIDCPRCGNTLRRVRRCSPDYGLAWAIAGLFFYVLAIMAPMLQVGIYGRYRSGAIETGPLTLDTDGYWIVASVVFLTTIVMPLIKLVATVIVLVCVRTQYTPRWIAWIYALLKHLKPWVMIEVYLLGFLVAYSRLQVIATVHLALAVFGLIGLMLSMLAMDAAIDPEAVWQKIKKRYPVSTKLPPSTLMGCDTCFQVSHASLSQDCPRCGEALHPRKPDSQTRTWALTIAAAILYVPSNTFPVMNLTKLGKIHSYTIFGGLQELAHVGLWPLAVLVFIASIAIPVFKLLMLIYMLIQTHRGATGHLHNRTRLYRLLAIIGRWSMVDIFVVSILAALVRFGWFTQITADMGALYFTSVVILTLLAVESFDPRLMWDSAEKHSKGRLTKTASRRSVAT